MKRIFSFALALLFVNAQAQTTGGSAFSLQQAIEYAYKNSPSLMNAELDIKSSVYRKQELLGVGLPQINASVDLKDYINIPTSLIPAKFTNPNAPDDAFIPVKFGTKYNSTAGFSVSQLIFSAEYFLGINASKELVNLSVISKARTKVDVASQVSKAYYGVLVGKERVKLLEANLVKLEKLFSDAKGLNEQGFIEKIDVDRIEVTLNNLKVEKEKVDRLILLSETVLKFQMGYKGTDNITLSDELSSATNDAQNLDAKVDAGRRSEMQLLEAQQRLYTADVRRLKWGYLPTLAAYGSLNYNAQRTKFDFFDGSKDWYNISLIGATLNLNIFDGFQRNNRIQQSKMNLQKTENNITQFKMLAELETATAVATYNNALTSVTVQKRNLELAQNVFDVSQKKFNAGVGSNTELINAQTSIKEAETNYYSSLYDLLVAKTDYLKATGNLVK